MADENTSTVVESASVNVDLTVKGAETFIPGSASTGDLPCTIYFLLYGTGTGSIYFRHGNAAIPRHRLAVLLGQVRLVDGAVSIDQHQVATLFLTRPTEDAQEDVENPDPPFCGHAGNAAYDDDKDRPGGGGGGQEEEDEGDDTADPPAVSPDNPPGGEEGETTPVSSEDCETDGDDPDTDEQPTEEQT